MSAEPQQKPTANQVVRLLLISFATLFFELVVIRWLASEVRVFAFMKNLTLMACVLGLGVGCAGFDGNKTENSGRSILTFGALFAALALVLALAPYIGLTNMSFVVTADVFDWQFGVRTATELAINVLTLTSIFLLVVAMFDVLGRQLGAEIQKMPPIEAYGVNIAGSLVGVIALSIGSFCNLNPVSWTIAGLLSLLPLLKRGKEQYLFLGIAGATIALAVFTVGNSLWTPYYRIDLKPLYSWTKSGVMLTAPYQLGTSVEVNHMQHQRTVDLSERFLKQHPELLGSAEYAAYNLPYEARQHPNKVLVLGAGTGNDVAAALAHGASQVDAVEIDPGIAALNVHPQQPYLDKRVHLYINDARAFLSKCKERYDLIVFGHLDSHTALSIVPSVRLDTYLYTREALASAAQHLTPDGVASLSFSAQPRWLQARLYQMAKELNGRDPLTVLTNFSGGNTILIFWGPGVEPQRARLEAALPNLANKSPEWMASLSQPVELTTDDWPFLYQQNRSVPPIYGFMIGSVMLIAGWLVTKRFRLNSTSFVANSQFFLLGTGFLLLETRGMLAVAVLFGSTWLVNSIVIAIVLAMALLSNFLVGKFRQIDERIGYAGLALGLIAMYAVPIAGFAGADLATKCLCAFGLIGPPFLFSGMVFSRAFSRTAQPQVALGVNILGAILGGCLEYLSAIWGVANLTLLAFGIYALSFVAMKVVRSSASASAAPQLGNI